MINRPNILFLPIVVFFMTIVSLTSCSDKVSNNQLSGVYIWNNSENGKLTINSDSTYSYIFNVDRNKTKPNLGTWEFDSRLQEVNFNNFRFTEREGRKGIWISRVRIKNNEIHLIYASDSNIYLKKVQ